MKRKDFLRQSSVLCLGAAAGISLFDSCRSTHYAKGSIHEGKLSVPLKEFTLTNKKGKTHELKYIVIRNDALEFPVAVFRNERTYQAVWMRCSHQGAELHASGDIIYCPAHGSEFNRTGGVVTGPADKPLRTFRTFTEGENLFIVLEK